MRASSGRWARIAVAALLAALLSVGPASSAFAVRTLGLSASSFEFSVAAGQSGSGDLLIMNDGDEPFDVFVYAANQVVGEDGEVTFQMPDRDVSTFRFSPASWYSIKIPSSTRTLGNLPVVSLKPGERVPVEFEFTVPTDAPAGDHQVILFFEIAQGELPEGGGAQAAVTGRLGCRTRIRVQGDIVERLDVRPFEIRQLILGAKAPWVFMARNEGNIDKTVDVKLALLDGSENERFVSELVTDTPLYAQSNLERSGVLEPGIPFGRFTARLTLEYPREGAQPGQSIPEQIVKERTVWIFPLWLAIAIVVLAGGFFLWLSWRGAVRSAQKKAERQRSARRDRRPTPAYEDDADYDDGPGGQERTIELTEEAGREPERSRASRHERTTRHAPRPRPRNAHRPHEGGDGGSAEE